FPVQVCGLSFDSAAHGILWASRALSKVCEDSFGCGDLVRIVRASFPFNEETDPFDIHFMLGAFEAAKQSGTLTQETEWLPLMPKNSEYVRRLVAWPLFDAIRAVRLAPVRQWLAQFFAGFDASHLKAELSLEFSLLTPPRPPSPPALSLPRWDDDA